MTDPQQAEKFAPEAPNAPTVTDSTPAKPADGTGLPIATNVVVLDGHPLIVLRQPTDEQGGAYLLALPVPQFWQRIRPHVLRLVGGAPEIEHYAPRARPLVYVVRPGHEEEDRAALDAALASQGGPIPRAFPNEDRPGMFTDWQLWATGYTVQVVADAALPNTQQTPETATDRA